MSSNRLSGVGAAMQCEVCGNDTESPRKILLDNIPMIACPNCAHLGKDVTQKPAREVERGVPPEVAERLERRARMAKSKDVFESFQQEMVPDYAKRIKEARERKGWTREQLSGKVGERVPTIAKFEHGEVSPTDQVARRLERELNIKLFENVPVVGGAQVKTPRKSFTLGDILKDAMKKKERDE